MIRMVLFKLLGFREVVIPIPISSWKLTSFTGVHSGRHSFLTTSSVLTSFHSFVFFIKRNSFFGFFWSSVRLWERIKILLLDRWLVRLVRRRIFFSFWWCRLLFRCLRCLLLIMFLWSSWQKDYFGAYCSSSKGEGLLSSYVESGSSHCCEAAASMRSAMTVILIIIWNDYREKANWMFILIWIRIFE